MPTIRGSKKGIDDKALKKVIDNYTAHIATIAARAGREAMKELRESAVKKWYNSTAQYAMHNSTYYESDPPKQSKGKIEITIRSYVNIDEFEDHKRIASKNNKMRSPYENLLRWRERHEKGNRGSDGKRSGTGYWTYYDREPSETTKLRTVLEMPYTIGEYLFNLPWEEGIVGLPPKERKTGTGWVNPKPTNPKEPLKDFLNGEQGQIKKKWNKAVQKKFNELMK